MIELISKKPIILIVKYNACHALLTFIVCNPLKYKLGSHSAVYKGLFSTLLQFLQLYSLSILTKTCLIVSIEKANILKCINVKIVLINLLNHKYNLKC